MFRVKVTWFRVQVSEFRVQSSGFRVQGSGWRGTFEDVLGVKPEEGLAVHGGHLPPQIGF